MLEPAQVPALGRGREPVLEPAQVLAQEQVLAQAPAPERELQFQNTDFGRLGAACFCGA